MEKRREKGSECFLSRGGKEEKVEQKEVETLGGEGDRWLKTTFSACTSGPSPQRPFATSRHFATPCAGLKLKSEHRPPPTVRKPRRDWQQLGDLLTLLLSTDSPAPPGV